MSANFTPNMGEYNPTGSFKFWCQKVLPLVYDDSLSYYELLCKVVNYLNDVIQNADALNDNVNGLYNAYVQLQDYVNNYFDNLDVQEEINNKLDIMAEDGTLTRLITQYLDFITPQMFGAKGDGVTDDTNAFKDAIASGKVILIPKGDYAISDNLTIPESSYLQGCAGTNLKFTGGHGLVLVGRYINICNLSISSDNTGIGIKLQSEVHYLTLNKVYINNFATGIENSTYMWNCVFDSVRITVATIGFKLGLFNIPNFNLTFTNCYCNHCVKDLKCDGTIATFIQCNFGIIANTTVEIASNSLIDFDGCNFECDSKVEAPSGLFSISGKNVTFKNCKFLTNLTADSTVFSFYSSTESVIFDGCIRTKSNSDEMSDDKFFNSAQFNASVGGIVYRKGCNTLPSVPLLSFPSTKLINFYNENVGALQFYQNIDKSRLTVGVSCYDLKSNKLGYYNGTNIVDGSGNIIA